MYRAVYPLLQKHASMRGVSTSKLVNDILTVWLYNATPRETLRFFNTHHTPAYSARGGPQSKAYEAFYKNWQDKLNAGRDAYLETIKKERKPRPDTKEFYEDGRVRAFNSAYMIDPNTDEYGVKYSLPPFPKDLPPGYLSSIGWTKERPLTDVGSWLRWAASQDTKMPR